MPPKRAATVWLRAGQPGNTRLTVMAQVMERYSGSDPFHMEWKHGSERRTRPGTTVFIM